MLELTTRKGAHSLYRWSDWTIGCSLANSLIDATIPKISDEWKMQSKSISWKGNRFSIDGKEVVVSLSPLAEVDGRLRAQWDALESRAGEGNMYLSSSFICPATRYLDPMKRLYILILRLGSSPDDPLVGLGVFMKRPPSKNFPLPHLEAYRSKYSQLTGMLLDKDYRSIALGAIAAYLSFAHSPWCGIRFEKRFLGGYLDRVGDSDLKPTVIWDEQYRHRRAVLIPTTAYAALVAILADGHLGRELKRKRRRLHEMGKVGWRFLSGSEVNHRVIESFLWLEHQGWKAERGSSLLSNPEDAEFFRVMSAKFAANGRAFFTELTLDGRVIASTSNFISGNIGYAFKIGWDQEFAAVSPGVLNELEFMANAEQCLNGVAYVDSGASQGAFIERFWPDRREVVTGTLVGGSAGTAVLPALSVARRLKRGLF